MEYSKRRTMFIVMLVMITWSQAQLSDEFYTESCPSVFSAVRRVLEGAVANDGRMAASLLRLFFHDCFVNGCDGSVLLDDTVTSMGEKTAGPNNNSARGFEVIDQIKSRVERICPGVVSCADILAIAARDSVKLLGGPWWRVNLGRRDSATANFTAANSGILPPPASTLTNLIERFQAQNLSIRDMVALSGAHTIGQARCITFRRRIYNASNIDVSFAISRQKICPAATGSGDSNPAAFDPQSPRRFDVGYYRQLLNRRGLLTSDQALYDGGPTDSIVATYSRSVDAFYGDFVRAMIKMGNIKPLTGSTGQIRTNCRRPN